MQAGGQRFDPAQLHQIDGVETDGFDGKCLLKKNKVCIGFKPDACSAYIVKRRLIWRLPGVGFDPMSEPSSVETKDGLVGRIWWRDWR